MDGHPIWSTLAQTFRIAIDGEVTSLLRSACRSCLDLYQRARETPNHVTARGAFTSWAAVRRVKQNVAPRSSFAVAHKRPPCESTMERLIASPMPEPCILVVKNASKI